MGDIRFVTDKNCTGCLSCIDICPVKALTVGLSAEGFYIPRLDEKLCDGCGECLRHCESIPKQVRAKNQKAYSAQAIDKNVLQAGTSGGFFQVVARELFDDEYYIFGPIYDSNMVLKHACAKSIDDIVKMGGSKYVQSDPSGTYMQVKQLLQTGKCVLFSGTPCQIAALKAFLGEENLGCLITIDLPCYGIPSVKFFHDTVKHYEKKYHGKMIDFRFRDKKKNGFSHTTVMTFQKRKKVFSTTIDDLRSIPYHWAFSKRNCFQNKCYACEYTNSDRVSDLTIGSFWGIQKITNMYCVSDGVSMILVNSEKGQTLFNRVSNKLIYQEHSLDQAYAANKALVQCLEKPAIRDSVLGTYIDYGYQSVVKQFYSQDLKTKIRTFLRRINKWLIQKQH